MSAPTQTRQPFRWRFNKGVVLFVVVFLPLTVALGFWQLDREREKRALLDEYRTRETARPRPLADLSPSGDHLYRRVQVRGRFDNNRTVLLENRIRRGRPGFEVVTLFILEDNAAPIWVNRGWLAGYLDRNRLPEVPTVEGVVSLHGHLYQPLAEPFVVGDEVWRQQWPQVLQNLDLDMLSSRLDAPFYPFRLRLDQGAPGALATGWTVVNVMPEKHRGYAIQWFAMAAALLLLALFANTNLGDVLLRRGSRNGSGES